MKRYYYAGSQRVAMRTGSTLNFLLGDHSLVPRDMLGSQAITTTSTGSKSAEIRYYPWGTERYTYGTTPTTFKFTGQRFESEIGLYYYGARWYDPAAGRFISADTIVPGAGNPQAYDRYAYSYGNPVKYIDPYGHKACTPMPDGSCDTTEEEILSLLDEIEESIDTAVIDNDKDGIPETPDENAEPVDVGSYIGCSQSSYVECFYDRGLLNINGKMNIDKKQLALLMIAVYYDVHKRFTNGWDRSRYDTPFWDAYGKAPGVACYGGSCYQRHEINYFAQGIYSAEIGQSLNKGEQTVTNWKGIMYQERASSGTMLWFDIGYLVYMILAGS
jgi:RHS repeat-associated protein